MIRLFCAIAALSFIGTTANAQIIRAPSGNPRYFITPTIGFANIQDVDDGTSQTVWQFGSALIYRVTLERRLTERTAVGALVSYSSIPLRYIAVGPAPAQPTCTQGIACSASVDQTTIAANFSSGGSYGLHQILNLAVGMTMYDNFRENSSGRQLAPLKVDRDFFLTIGYGFGIGLSRHFAINIVQDYGMIVHQRDGLEGNASTNSRIIQTRLGAKIGFGR